MKTISAQSPLPKQPPPFRTAIRSLRRRWGMLASLVPAVLLLVGCLGPISPPSRLMMKGSPPVGGPPPGQSLVCIHRPRNHQGYNLYTGIWDSNHFIADLGNGNSVAYVCAPGIHYFINRSVERVGVVDANLLPNQTYDLWVDIAGAWIASFQLEPVKAGSREQKEVSDWTRENAWVDRAAPAAEHEQLRQSEIALILKDFVSGEKKDRMRHLSAEDHR